MMPMIYKMIGAVNEWKWNQSKALKSDKKLCYLFDRKPFEVIKNAFCFILKARFILKIFKFLPRLFGHVGIAAWLEI